MKSSVIIGVALAATLGAALSLGAQVARGRAIVSPLSSYPQQFATINRELPLYTKATADMDSLGIRRSTDGGKLEASCKGSETRLIVATEYGEHGYWETRYYYWNNALFYVQASSSRSEELYGNAVEIKEDRLYYLNGKLVRWLDARNAVHSLNTEAARKLGEDVSKDSNLFFSKVSGCGESDSVAAATTDTSAPNPQLAQAVEQGRLASMKQDLRNFATYEEQYAADINGAYFSGVATEAAPLQGFTPSNNVTIYSTSTAGSRPDWRATSTHSQTLKKCESLGGTITCYQGSDPNVSAPPSSSMAPSVTRLSYDRELTIAPSTVQPFIWTATRAQPNCHVTGHIVVTDGGSKDVQVVVTSSDDFQNWVNGHDSKAYFQTGKTTAVTLDVNTGYAGPMVLGISNMFSLVSGKVVRLTGLQVTCR